MSKLTAFERYTIGVIYSAARGTKLLYRVGFHAASCLNWLLSKDTAFRWTAFIQLQEGQNLLYRGGFHAASCLNWLLLNDTAFRWTAFILLQEGEQLLYRGVFHAASCLNWLLSKDTAFRWTAFILLQEGQKLLYRGGFHAASCLKWLLSKDTRLDCLYSAARGTKTTVSWWFPRSIMSKLTAFERYTIGLPLFCGKRDKHYRVGVVSTQHHV